MKRAQWVAVLIVPVAIIGVAASAHAQEALKDCPSELGSSRSHVARMQQQLYQTPRLQLLAKKIADALENEPYGGEYPPSSFFVQIYRKFMAAFRAQTKSDPDSRALENWLQYISDRQVLACFPDLNVTMRKMEPRVKEAREAFLERQKESKQRQQEWAKKEAARARLPVNRLARAYAAYIDVKRCHDARRDYSVGYITTLEMAQARKAVQQIEKALKPELDPDTTVDFLWSRVEQAERGHFSPSRDYDDYTRRQCRRQLDALLNSWPGSGRVEKDF